MNLVERLVERAAQHPGQGALVEGSGMRRRVLRYSELEQRVAAGAGGLRENGIGPGDSVLFLHPVSLDLYVALLAVFRVGACAIFIDPSARRDVVRSAVCRIAPKGFFASPKAHLWRLIHPPVRRLPCHFTTVPWIPGIRWPDSGKESEIVPCEPEVPALITFTSGSTGEPKAVVRTHGFLQAQYEVLQSSIALEEGEIDLVTLPVFALANLAAGVTSVLADTNLAKPGEVHARRVGEQLASEGVTRCAASPAFFQSLLEAGVVLDRFRKIYTGGAPVFPHLLERLASAAPLARVEAVYGSSEAEPISHVERREVRESDREAMCAGRGLLVGRPVPEIRLAVIPNTWGNPVPGRSEDAFKGMCLPPGAPGEIVVSGRHVLQGYLDGRGDEETKFRVGETVWHRTGDAGWMDSSGRLWLLGRAGAVIRREKGDLSPFAVETALSFYPEVRRSALVARGNRAVLAVEWVNRDSERGMLRIQNTVSWASIDRIVPVDRIPVDRRHQAKVDYPALAKVLDRKGADF